MKVILLGNYIHDRQESMQRYAAMLHRLLPKAGIETELWQPTPFFGRLQPSGHGIGKWLGYVDKFIIFPFLLRARLRHEKKHLVRTGGNRPLLVHICDHANAMYTAQLEDFPHLVTCHDLIAIQSARGLIPESTTRWTGRLLQSWILAGLRRTQYIVCVSKKTRQDLLTLLPEFNDRSEIIENALSYPYSPMSIDQARPLLASLGLKGFFSPDKPDDDRYLLHVGSNQWSKNRNGVIRIFVRLKQLHPNLPAGKPQLKLIFAGQPPTEAMTRLVKEHGLENDVLFAVSISNEQLRSLYTMAEALVFPSLMEGFGWPIIEAQACGCPVVTSNREPMNAIGGPAVLYADPENVDDFAAKLAILLSEDKASRDHRKNAAQGQAALYQPESFIQKMIATYQTILNPNGK